MKKKYNPSKQEEEVFKNVEKMLEERMLKKVPRQRINKPIKSTTFVIDIDIWATPINYAKLKGVTKQVVNNWIKRGRLETWHIPELGLKLIKIDIWIPNPENAANRVYRVKNPLTV